MVDVADFCFVVLLASVGMPLCVATILQQSAVMKRPIMADAAATKGFDEPHFLSPLVAEQFEGRKALRGRPLNESIPFRGR